MKGKKGLYEGSDKFSILHIFLDEFITPLTTSFTVRAQPICTNRNKCDKYMNIVSLFFQVIAINIEMLWVQFDVHNLRINRQTKQND